jgi:hypothetical protein
MVRSRKGALGLVALGCVSLMAMSGCSSTGTEGWHEVGPSAPTFTDGKGCTFRLDEVVDPTFGGIQVVVTDASPGGTCAGAPLQAIAVTQVLCTYVQQSGAVIPYPLNSDSCPGSLPHGLGNLTGVISAYTSSASAP